MPAAARCAFVMRGQLPCGCGVGVGVGGRGACGLRLGLGLRRTRKCGRGLQEAVRRSDRVRHVVCLRAGYGADRRAPGRRGCGRGRAAACIVRREGGAGAACAGRW